VSGNTATGDGGGAYSGGNQFSIATSKVVNVGIQEGSDTVTDSLPIFSSFRCPIYVTVRNKMLAGI
jgi:hypothetical protein